MRKPETSGPAPLLVVGYGNTLRRDDGVGPKVAEAVAELNLKGVQVLVCPQLTPEFADPISQARVVVFVDAAVDAPRGVQLRKLEPAETSQIMAHAAEPRTMLALARDVFGHAPEAWWLTIPVEELGFGEELSPLAQRGFDQALHAIQQLAANAQAGEVEVGREPVIRLKLVVRGAVQGVGFRPFVHRLAAELSLAGWVNNSAQGVFIEVEGSRPALEQFFLRLEAERPPHSFIQSLESSWLDPVGYAGFEIRPSDTGGGKTALVLPDIATCPDCLREIFDPANRRYRYPFTNCTHCGPRFSIITALPYDRANTTMAGFTMCSACRAEYENPSNRRFHAQPNACPVCGPQLEFRCGGVRQNAPERSYAALLAAANCIRAGQIVAVKGLGGFHLMVNARNEAAVRRLRERKHREEKPLALMFPSLESVKVVCEVSALEERLLCSPEAPIVLLNRLVCPHPGPLPQERENRAPPSVESETVGCLHGLQNKSETQVCFSLSPGERGRVRAGGEAAFCGIALSVAPANPHLGAMLPYTPLHHLLLAELGLPVVATSGNLSDEPICTDEHEAVERLRDIADVFLVHNRPIARHVDDSVVRVMLDRELVLRRARGYAPLPISLKSKTQRPESKVVLAVGAHLKNTVALAVGPQVFISQHIGDLETEQANNAFRRVIADFQELYEASPEVVVADLHPDYLSTKFALELGAPTVVQVQHHIAHVLSGMAENELEPPVLGVAWDGSGYGLDGAIWGGEFFRVTECAVERVAHFRPFRLPGGDRAVKEPRRSAFGLLHELASAECKTRLHMQRMFAAHFSAAEQAALESMLQRGINSPRCTSVGRLFDAVASLAGLRQRVRFEGQAAMELEFALEGVQTDETYPLEFFDHGMPSDRGGAKSEIQTPASAIVLDWSPMIEAILADTKRDVSLGDISAKFHNTLVEVVVRMAQRIGEPRVVLSGGCFQNRYLTERTVQRLRAEGFLPYWHQRVPPNDGGIALGQVVAAMRGYGVGVTPSV